MVEANGPKRTPVDQLERQVKAQEEAGPVEEEKKEALPRRAPPDVLRASTPSWMSRYQRKRENKELAK